MSIVNILPVLPGILLYGDRACRRRDMSFVMENGRFRSFHYNNSWKMVILEVLVFRKFSWFGYH